jgi:hypothetical protein
MNEMIATMVLEQRDRLREAARKVVEQWVAWAPIAALDSSKEFAAFVGSLTAIEAELERQKQ